MCSIVCFKCQLLKRFDEYRQREKGISYDICMQCRRENLALFWTDKQYRVCNSCHDKLPIILKYSKDEYGIPYATCRECYQKKVKEDYRKRWEFRVIPLELVEPKPLTEIQRMHLEMLGPYDDSCHVYAYNVCK